MPPFSFRDLTMPVAAFTMAIVLTAHVYNSINHARLDAAIARDQKLNDIQEKRKKRYADALRTIEEKSTAQEGRNQ
ncbi:uncharacterized protein I303_106714 [Kwoniella dejecticola CBS 10117]|uniref:Uncharacterized protein n=1 Tax=Kwoniella dejecticola CBS 10117 TaxID=1296121 RepID=A0A1A5ZTX1_9TREE|nr:uncharacterized protein I303_08644 [Kwoniella dejecticola CBS 10117]OBR81258.1 hypothetical protein I303_08644 [Kwoniella dejecticola CBS 10117]